MHQLKLPNISHTIELNGREDKFKKSLSSYLIFWTFCQGLGFMKVHQSYHTLSPIYRSAEYSKSLIDMQKTSRYHNEFCPSVLHKSFKL